MMETPVLLLTYNRPVETQRVLNLLRSVGAVNVYFWTDNLKDETGRQNRDDLIKLAYQYREIVRDSCMSLEHLGCRESVISGIDWFFSEVDEGIILEDDCLPGPHFFPFVNDMLKRYRNEQKVMMIGGNNPLGEWQTEGGHHFSRSGTIWGWATWKDRWLQFDPKLPKFKEFVANQGFERAFGPTELAASRFELTRRSLRGEIDTWDYQWNAHILMNNGLAVIPEKNLVENIGFNSDGTNVHSKPNWIRNSVAVEPIRVDSRPIQIDREFEMEWELARRANLPANASSFSFEKKGTTGKQQLKILLINSTDIGGGAEKIAFSLHQKLLELGHESRMLVQVKKSELDSVQEMDDRKAQIRDFQPDVIHIHNLHGMSICLNEFSDLVQKTPVLFTLHDTWLASGSTEHPFEPNPEKLNLLELKAWKKEFKKRKEILRNGNFRFIAPSQWMREVFFHAHGIRPFHIPNEIELTESVEVEIPSKRFILFVANQPETNPYKDFATLKKAWKKANENLRKNACDLIVLGGEPKTEKFGHHSIFVLKKQSSGQVMAFMEQSLLVVQASFQDNAPLTILEAHAAGKKVVASLVGGIPELLDDQERRLMYEAGNAVDLAKKLVEAVELGTKDKNIRDGKTRSLERMTDTYLGHYFELTAEP